MTMSNEGKTCPPPTLTQDDTHCDNPAVGQEIIHPPIGKGVEHAKEEVKREGATQNTGETATTTTVQEKQEDTQSTCSTASSSTSSSPSHSSTSSSEGSNGSPSTQEASRAINIEDSDKKYVVIEPNKPKTWLAAYKLVSSSLKGDLSFCPLRQCTGNGGSPFSPTKHERREEEMVYPAGKCLRKWGRIGKEEKGDVLQFCCIYPCRSSA